MPTAALKSCRTIRRSWSPRPARPPTRAGAPPRESVAPIHHAAGCDLAADGGDSAGRHRRLYTIAGLGAAEVDYPTIQVLTFYPGASPDVMATTVTAPLERQFGQMQGLSQMTSTSSGGTSVIVLQFTLSLNIDVAEEEVQSAINASQSYLPANLPAPPGLQQDESRRRAGADAGHHFRFGAAVASGRPGGHAAGSEAIAAQWRRPGEHQRRAKAGGAHPGQPGGAVFVWHQSRGAAHRARFRPA